MRTSRAAVVASGAGLAAGSLTSVLAALWLAWSLPDADMVWNHLSPLRIGMWIVEAAHGVPTIVRSAAGISAPTGSPAGSMDRLSELLSSGSDVVFTFSLFLAPVTILAITGITTAVLVRRAAPGSNSELARWTAAGALTHGVLLALLSQISNVTLDATGTLAPDLGLGAATGHVAFSITHAPLLAFVLGAVWGAAFTAAGGLSSLRMRSAITSDDRVVLFGWMRALGLCAGVLAAVMLLGAIVAAAMGRMPVPRLVALGALLVSGNAVAAGIVFCSGVPMAVALDAGPFTGWERADLFHTGAAGSAPPVVWLAVLLPLAAGVLAGRFIRRRSAYPPGAIALRYGALWGLALAVMAMLVRVRVLSSFSVGGLDLGGGSAAFDPLLALVIGAVVGGLSSFLGARSVSEDATWTCPACGIANASVDRFCVSCGAVAVS